MNKETVKAFLNKENIFAVVGASRDPKKYGYQVYKDLTKAGYKVYPVNPNAEEILGSKCYSSLENLPKKPDVVDIVVPPEVAEETVARAVERSAKKTIYCSMGSVKNVYWTMKMTILS